MILQAENRTSSVIPDNNPSGLVSTINVLKGGKIESIFIEVDIEHPYIGDLSVKLISPSKKELVLHNRQGGNHKNLKKKFESEELTDLIGDKSKGQWKLVCHDFAPQDQGKLNNWTIGINSTNSKSASSDIFIPDSTPDGLASQQYCKHIGKVKEITLHVNVEHSFTGDLSAKLIAPSGNSVVVHDRAGGNKDNLVTSYDSKVLAALIGESAKGKWTLQLNDHAPKDAGLLKSWKLDLRLARKDDLKVVEGIGPKIEELLNNAGIRTYSALSKSSPLRLKNILVGGGDRFKMHNPGTWPDQSKMANEGRWDELKKWQDELDGGR